VLIEGGQQRGLPCVRRHQAQQNEGEQNIILGLPCIAGLLSSNERATVRAGGQPEV